MTFSLMIGRSSSSSQTAQGSYGKTERALASASILDKHYPRILGWILCSDLKMEGDSSEISLEVGLLLKFSTVTEVAHF